MTSFKEFTMLPEELDLSLILMTLFASCGGALLRYAEEYKIVKRIRFSFLLCDVISSGFFGFFLSWYLLEEGIVNLPEIMLILIISGFLGSKVFNIASFFIKKRLGINFKFYPIDQDNSKLK